MSVTRPQQRRRSVRDAAYGALLVASAFVHPSSVAAEPEKRFDLRLGEQKHLGDFAQPWGVVLRFPAKPSPLSVDLSLTANAFLDGERVPRATPFLGTGVRFFVVDDAAAVSRPQASPAPPHVQAELLVERIDDADAMLRAAIGPSAANEPGTEPEPPPDPASYSAEQRLRFVSDEITKRLPEAMTRHDETLSTPLEAFRKSAAAVAVRLDRGLLVEPRKSSKPSASKRAVPEGVPALQWKYAFTRSGAPHVAESVVLAIGEHVLHLRISGPSAGSKFSSAVAEMSFSAKPRKPPCLLKLVESVDHDKSDPNLRHRYLAFAGPCGWVLDVDRRRAEERNLVVAFDGDGKGTTSCSLHVQGARSTTAANASAARMAEDRGVPETQRDWTAPTGAGHLGTAFSAKGAHDDGEARVSWFVVQLGDAIWGVRIEAAEGAKPVKAPPFPWQRLACNVFERARK